MWASAIAPRRSRSAPEPHAGLCLAAVEGSLESCLGSREVLIVLKQAAKPVGSEAVAALVSAPIHIPRFIPVPPPFKQLTEICERVPAALIDGAPIKRLRYRPIATRGGIEAEVVRGVRVPALLCPRKGSDRSFSITPLAEDVAEEVGGLCAAPLVDSPQYRLCLC